eukprot:scaffold2876_cov123-Isochrysis_galbana.AAC.7
MGCHPDTGIGKKQNGANSEKKTWREGCRRVLLCCSIAAVDGSRSQVVAGSSRTNILAAMPPFLAICGGLVGGVVENGCRTHSVSSHTDRASRVTTTTGDFPAKLQVYNICTSLRAGIFYLPTAAPAAVLTPIINRSTREGVEGFSIWYNPLFRMPHSLKPYKEIWEHLINTNTLDNLVDRQGTIFDADSLENYLTEDNG